MNNNEAINKYECCGGGAMKTDFAKLFDLTNKNALDSAQAKINNAQANLDLAEENLTIAKNGATPQQIAIQESRIITAEQQLLIAQNGARPEDLSIQYASVAQARASLALAVANKEKAIVRSPIAGKVIHLPVDIGDIASSSSIIVSTIIN